MENQQAGAWGAWKSPSKQAETENSVPFGKIWAPGTEN